MTNSGLDKYTNFLLKRLKERLPGRSAHKLMSPKSNGQTFRNFERSADASNSAVLLLITMEQDVPEILFTLRSQTLNNHSGQISFPGGRIENNESIEEAALRETNEETGIDIKKIRIIGRLSTLYVPPSNSIIHPVVGIIKKDDIKITINEDEVEEVFFTKVTDLLDSDKKFVEKWDFENQELDVPLWKIHPTVSLWGATAMILSEFLVISKSYFTQKQK
jgi:8-oxo-dGTP pyrophosphatase MutT (NUDIX family)